MRHVLGLNPSDLSYSWQCRESFGSKFLAPHQHQPPPLAVSSKEGCVLIRPSVHRIIVASFSYLSRVILHEICQKWSSPCSARTNSSLFTDETFALHRPKRQRLPSYQARWVDSRLRNLI